MSWANWGRLVYGTRLRCAYRAWLKSIGRLWSSGLQEDFPCVSDQPAETLSHCISLAFVKQFLHSYQAELNLSMNLLISPAESIEICQAKRRLNYFHFLIKNPYLLQTCYSFTVWIYPYGYRIIHCMWYPLDLKKDSWHYGASMQPEYLLHFKINSWNEMYIFMFHSTLWGGT